MSLHVSLLERIEIPGPDATPTKLASKAITQLTKADIEAVRDVRRAAIAAAASISRAV
jgi:hypothetical protein